jgi:hypothetical protein
MYTIVTCLMDYNELRLQYRNDEVHFGMLSGGTWWQNILAESDRYKFWYSGAGLTFQNLPLTVPHLFQALAALAVLYLAVLAVIRRRLDDGRIRILLVTLIAALFFAIVSRKTIYYVIHIETWLALCAGILIVDGARAARHWRFNEIRLLRWAYMTMVVVLGAALLVYSLLLVRQSRRYLREVRNPDLASFEEFTEVIRSVVPNGVCPVAVKAPVIWLAFPESDRCFATIEKRMLGSIDIDGKDYALVTLEKGPDNWSRDLISGHHLIGRLIDSPYGDLSIYYTGTDPEFLKVSPVGYRFFGRRRGHITCEIAGGPPVNALAGN